MASHRQEQLKVYPLLGFVCIQAKAAGAWRVWTVAKSLDPDGSGVVENSALRRRLSRLGASERSIRRWIRKAERLEMLEPVYGADRYLMAAPHRVALAVGAEQVGNPAAMPARLLFLPGYRASLWGAFVAALRGRPMSLARASNLTGVPKSTLSRWDNRIGTERERNLADSGLPGDYACGLRESGRETAFKGPNGNTWWRLPDTRRPPDGYESLPRGRRRKIERKIRAALSKQGQGTEHDPIARLFYGATKAAERAVRRVVDGTSVHEVYAFSRHATTGTAVWSAHA